MMGDNPVVGILGVGAMGTGIAARLVENGYRVMGFRRSSMDEFANIGGEPMPDAASVVAGADIVLLLLPTDDALLQVMSSIGPALKADQILACLSVNKAQIKHQAAAMAADKGAVILDGAISGTPAMLKAGQASVMIAGDPDAIASAVPVMNGFANSVSRLPSFGDANNIKLLTNSLVGLHTLAAAETLLMARRMGLDSEQVVEAISASAGGSMMMRVRGMMMANGQIPPGDMRGFMQFYEMLRDALPDDAATARPLTILTEQTFRQCIEQGQGMADIAGIYDFLSTTVVEAETIA